MINRSRYAMLTADDWDTIEVCGSYMTPPESLILLKKDSVIFTIYGLQFYKAACDFYGLKFDFSKIFFPEDFFGLERLLMRSAHSKYTLPPPTLRTLRARREMAGFLAEAVGPKLK